MSNEEADRRPLLIAVVLLLAWTYTHGLARNPLKWEEPRRCLVAMEMIERGDYIVPHLLGEPYLNKPPLQNWLIVLFSWFEIPRVGAVPIRLVTLLALAGTAILLWRLGGSESERGKSLSPALVFLTLGIVAQFGRAGEIDILFCFFITASVAAFELGRRRGSSFQQWYVSQVLLAAGVLTKGLAPLFFYPPVLFCVFRRPRQFPFSRRAFALGFASFAVLVAAWLVPYAWMADAGSLRHQWMAQLSDRTVGLGPLGALKHLVRYPVLVLGTALPWSLFLLAVTRQGWRSFGVAIARDGYLALCRAMIVWSVAIFVFVPGIRERYLIPVLPFAAVLLAALVQGAETRPAWTRLGRASLWLPWILAALVWPAWILVASRGLERGERWLAFSLGALAIAFFAWQRLVRGRVVRGAFVLLAGLLYAIQFAAIKEQRDARKNAPLVQAAAELAAAVKDTSPVACARDVDRKVACEMSRRLGRTLRFVPARGSYWFLARSGAAPPAAGEAIARAPGYELWLVPESEALSLGGKPLFRPRLGEAAMVERLARLGEARAAWGERPEDPEAWIWLGRRLAYLGRYGEAIDVFSQGIERFPDDPRFYRHRGHRFITIRRFDLAVRDLTEAERLAAGRADEIEPDGLPNARNIPTSTLAGNIGYHLGLAYYLQGDLERAREAYVRCLALSRNPDTLVAVSHWLHATLRRLARDQEARELLRPIEADLDVIENHAYHRLLLLYKGRLGIDDLLDPEPGGEPVDPAVIYGVGAWQLYNGRRDEAIALFEDLVRRGDWAAFGSIAAEADLARLQGDAAALPRASVPP